MSVKNNDGCPVNGALAWA